MNQSIVPKSLRADKPLVRDLAIGFLLGYVSAFHQPQVSLKNLVSQAAQLWETREFQRPLLQVASALLTSDNFLLQGKPAKLESCFLYLSDKVLARPKFTGKVADGFILGVWAGNQNPLVQVSLFRLKLQQVWGSRADPPLLYSAVEALLEEGFLTGAGVRTKGGDLDQLYVELTCVARKIWRTK